MDQDRMELYRQLESIRKSKLLVYVTGDRRNLETQIHSEVLDYLINHLDAIGTVPKISLFLYTKGGHTLAAWSIANLILQFCNEFEVIIPAKAHSAGTLLSLGANNIIMTKQATLGPIDPSVNTPLNPHIPEAPPDARVSVSVEAITGYIDLAKEIGITDSEDVTKVFSDLSKNVHPLVLGQVFRTRSQIRMLGRRLLSKHMDENIENILSFLCSESGSHDYHIYRQEARDELKLNVNAPTDEEYRIIKSIYDDVAEFLSISNPFVPDVMRGGRDEQEYELPRAIIESVTGGSHVFISKGRLIKRQVVLDEKNNIVQEATQDTRTYEGWIHERVEV